MKVYRLSIAIIFCIQIGCGFSVNTMGELPDGEFKPQETGFEESGKEEPKWEEEKRKFQEQTQWKRAEIPTSKEQPGIDITPPTIGVREPTTIETALGTEMETKPELPEGVEEPETIITETQKKLTATFEPSPDILEEVQPKKGVFEKLWEGTKKFVKDLITPEKSLSTQLPKWETDTKNLVDTLVELDQKVIELLDKPTMTQKERQQATLIIEQVNNIAKEMDADRISKAMTNEYNRLSAIQKRATGIKKITSVTVEEKAISSDKLTNFELLSQTYDQSISKLQEAGKSIDQLYQILGLEPGEDSSTITKQHIDEQMKKLKSQGKLERGTSEGEAISQANFILSDPAKKAEYDAFLKDYSKLKKQGINVEFKKATTQLTEGASKTGVMIILDQKARDLLKQESAVQKIVPTEKQVQQIQDLKKILEEGKGIFVPESPGAERTIMDTWSAFQERIGTLIKNLQKK